MKRWQCGHASQIITASTGPSDVTSVVSASRVTSPCYLRQDTSAIMPVAMPLAELWP